MLPNSKPTQKQAKAGLRQRPSFTKIMGIIEEDYKVKLPDRRYKTLMESPEYNALASEPAMDEIENQQLKVIHEQQKEALLTQKAIKSNDTGVKELKAAESQTSSNTHYFDMATGDDAPMAEDEGDVAEEIEGRKEQKRNKLGVIKDIVRTRFRHTRTTVDRFITPTPPQTNDAGMQTAPEPVQPTAPHPISINKKVKTKIEGEKKQRRKGKRKQ
jgi:hypothetical protein